MIREIHSFDVEVAKEVGVVPAVMLNNLYFWVRKNEANGANYYDGKYWTYNSKVAFKSLFPYLTARQIGTALSKLKDNGLIETGNYNKSPFDKTTWYTITEQGYALLGGDIRLDKNVQSTLDNTVSPIGQKCSTNTIYKTNTDINTNNKTNILCSEQLKNSSEQYANVPALILNDKSEHRITISDLNRYKELYPAVDVEQAIRNMAGWLDAHPSKRKTKRGINAFVNSWLSREQDSGGNQKGKVVVNRQRTDGNYYDLIAEEE